MPQGGPRPKQFSQIDAEEGQAITAGLAGSNGDGEPSFDDPIEIRNDGSLIGRFRSLNFPPGVATVGGDPSTADLDIFSSNDHSSTDHAGITGVNNFDSAAHAATDHSGIADGETESVTNAPGTGTDITRTIPSNTLGANGESLTFELWGLNTTGLTDDVTVTFGSTTILIATSIPIDGATPNSEFFVIRGTILRTGSATQEIYCTVSGATSPEQLTQVVSGTEDLTTALALTAADANNRIAFNALVIRKWSA